MDVFTLPKQGFLTIGLSFHTGDHNFICQVNYKIKLLIMIYELDKEKDIFI